MYDLKYNIINMRNKYINMIHPKANHNKTTGRFDYLV